MGKISAIESNDIAIIGMAGRFPESDSIEQMWSALVHEKDCITRNMDLNTNDYVNAYGQIKFGFFDAEFFGISHAEAEMMDPQQRMLFTLVYEALENANLLRYEENPIGLFAGADEFQYVWKRIYDDGHGKEMDYYVNRFFLGGSFTYKASYHFNLTGPSLTTRGACATSLLNVHLACQSLLNEECRVAVAGGISIYPEQNGYYIAEGTLSKDGYTRSFSDDASGFVPGNGGALVVLKRLQESIEDGDHIYAVIKGSAINNDGKHKIGYSAPSVLGELRAIQDAMKKAKVKPSDIGYIETHGTGTIIGDAVELEALNQAFSEDVESSVSWPIGSAKTNFGHLSITAGITGLIKATLMLYHKKLVPSLNFSKPKDKFNEGLPFYVNTEYKDWVREDGKALMAGVSSFGIGGTNVHMIVEEYPKKTVHEEKFNKSFYLFPYSGKREIDVSKYEEKLSGLIESENVSPKDIEYTLFQYRQRFPYCNAGLLYPTNKTSGITSVSRKPIKSMKNPRVIFMYPGTTLISSENILSLCKEDKFQESISKCFHIIQKETGMNVWDELNNDPIKEQLIMPITFSINYALTELWESMGVFPDFIVGNSLGEINAACAAGVIKLYDALKMVIKRAELFSTLPSGDIVSVLASSEKIEELQMDGVSISAINAKNRIMISGLTEDIEKACDILSSKKIINIKAGIGRPGHCKAVEPILEEYEEYLKDIEFHENQISIISTCTGDMIGQEEWCQPKYWVKQTRQPVLFKQAMEHFAHEEDIIYLEIGIGDQLTKIVRKMIGKKEGAVAIESVDPNNDSGADRAYHRSLVLLWCYGVKLDCSGILASNAKKVMIPSYPFLEKLYLWKSNGMGEGRNSAQTKSTIIVNGFDYERMELTKYLAANREKLIIVERDKTIGKKTDLDDLYSFISQVETEHISKSQIKCLKERENLITAYDQLCISAAADYFRSIFADNKYKQGISKAELNRKLQTIDQYLVFQDRLLKCLLDGGYIIDDGERYQVLEAFHRIPDLKLAIEQADRENHEFLPFMNFFAYCAEHYQKVFQGQMQGKEVLYPGGEYKLLNQVYEQIPTTNKIEVYASIIAQSVCHLIKKNGSKVRILEFGAGTGLVSWEVIEKIKGMDVEYCFTDIGRSFLTEGEARAKKMNYNFVRFEKFDITEKPESQNLALASYDIVLSCNVIQAMEHMEETLKNVTGLFKKNGILFLLQTVEGHSIQEMIFGLTPEWWNYAKDSKRGALPTLSYEEWEKLLRAQGFECIRIFPEDAGVIQSDVALIVGEYCREEEPLMTAGYETQIEVLKKINPQTALSLVSEGSSIEEHLKRLEVQYPEWEIVLADEKEEHQGEGIEAICRNDTDERLLNILFDTVGIRPESLEQPIFELGVDSLSGLMISTKIRTEFDIVFSIKDIMAIESIRELSDTIAASKYDRVEKPEEELQKTAPKKGLGDLLGEVTVADVVE